MRTETFYGSSSVSAALSIVTAHNQMSKFKLKGYKLKRQSTNTVQSGTLFETTIIAEYTKI